MTKRHRRKKVREGAEDADLAERQEGRGVGDSDVRDLVGGTCAELFGADHASEVRHRRSCRQGLVDLWRPRRRVAAHQHARPASDPGTFFTNARCTEEYPDAVKQIVKSGHRSRRPFLYPGSALAPTCRWSEQDATIRKSIDLLEACGGKKVTGWASPVVAFTPETAGLLAKAGLSWTTRRHLRGPADQDTTRRTASIAGVPTTDFSDNRVHARVPARPVRRAQRHVRLSAPERDHGLRLLVHPLPVRRPPADHGGIAGAAQIHAEVARRLVRPPRGAGAWALSRTSTSTPSRAAISS